MKDLIERQAAIDAVCSIDEYNARSVSAIKELSSAQPEIVRCRDCKHWDTTWSNNWSHDYHYCPVMDEVRKGNRHCRYAERRTDE